jgi:hypothetical protein
LAKDASKSQVHYICSLFVPQHNLVLIASGDTALLPVGKGFSLMLKQPKPNDTELLDVIIPVLVKAKLEGIGLTVAGERAVQAVRKVFPQMSPKRARAAVTRLRIL